MGATGFERFDRVATVLAMVENITDQELRLVREAAATRGTVILRCKFDRIGRHTTLRRNRFGTVAPCWKPRS